MNKRKKVIMDLIHDELYVPMKQKEMAIVLQVAGKDREDFSKLIKELESEDRIHITKRGKIMKSTRKKKNKEEKLTGSHSTRDDLIQGTFISNARGFGFVEVEDQEEDFFIPAKYCNGAMHQDIVRIELLPESRGQRKEGKVVEIVARTTDQIVGSFQKSKNFGFVVSDSDKIQKDLFIPQGKAMGAVTGHKVVAKIVDYGDENRKPEGKIVEILGHENDPGVDILSMVRAYDLPVEFSGKIMRQVERVNDVVTDADREGRIDYRDLQMVTIDGEDAKDLDDAVSLQMDGDNYVLGVHIADVSNYVQENSALDREALKRGTSVYLVDRVIPMLPHKLSNGICSLNAGEDRLAMSCTMTISPDGEVIDSKVEETVIKVDRRMSYTIVAKLLKDEDEDLAKEHEALLPMFFKMQELALILRARRQKRGSIDFDFPETKVILDAKGKPVEIKPYDRNDATKLIEDFMLIANETVAETFYWMEIPFLYRTHDTPDEEKMLKLTTFINNFGYGIKSHNKTVHPKEIQRLLGKLEGTPEEPMISRLTLRSMKQAAYSTQATGHFGLACDYYSHFTSPIRRYPDLQIHRIMKEYIRGRMNDEKKEHYRSILPSVALDTSKRERVAQELERETIKMKQVEYMEVRIGEVFDGVISGVTGWGVYVELPDTIEGMIHISELPGDYYLYEEENYEIVGEKTGRTFKLGQPVTIRVKNTDKLTRKIDFELVE